MREEKHRAGEDMKAGGEWVINTRKTYEQEVSQSTQEGGGKDFHHLPEVAFVSGIFDVIANVIKHSVCCCAVSSVEHLVKNNSLIIIIINI